MTVLTILSPLFIKRKLSEMNFQTKILITGVIMLNLTMAKKALFEEQVIADIDALQETRIVAHSRSEKLMDCMNILITGYGYVINLFPIIK